MLIRLAFGLVVTLLSAQAQPAAPAKNDYSDPKNWLCRPGRQDACAIDNTTTIVAADGRLTTETWKANPNTPIDCFYVYPTVSTDPGTHSDMTADPAEHNVIRQQFARLASVCRPYAPLYRQVTLAAVRQWLASGTAEPDGTLGYLDVRDAWNDYLKRDNRGRGVVLVGHSQGAGVLTSLLAQEIEGKPVHQQLVSALLIGGDVSVLKGKDVGGVFKSTPLCRAASQTRCVIAFGSFRSTMPPSSNTIVGKSSDAALEMGCTNPAALAGGSGELKAYLATEGFKVLGTEPPQPPWLMPPAKIATSFVAVPGLLTARCASNEHANYLEITVKGNPSDPRTDDIAGDLGVATSPLAAQFGLHLIDMNLAMGNFVDIIAQQAKAYRAKRN